MGLRRRGYSKVFSFFLLLLFDYFLSRDSTWIWRGRQKRLTEDDQPTDRPTTTDQCLTNGFCFLLSLFLSPPRSFDYTFLLTPRTLPSMFFDFFRPPFLYPTPPPPPSKPSSAYASSTLVLFSPCFFSSIPARRRRRRFSVKYRSHLFFWNF